MNKYSEGQAVQVLHDANGAEIWLNATIKNILDDEIQVKYTDRIPNYNRKLEFIKIGKLATTVRPFQEGTSGPLAPLTTSKFKKGDIVQYYVDDSQNWVPAEIIYVGTIGKFIRIEYNYNNKSKKESINECEYKDKIQVAAIDFNHNTSITSKDVRKESESDKSHEAELGRVSPDDAGDDNGGKADVDDDAGNGDVKNQNLNVFPKPHTIQHDADNDDDSKVSQKVKIRTWNEKAMSQWLHQDVISWINSLPKSEKYCSDKFPKYVNGKELLKTTEFDLKLIIVKDMWRDRFMQQLEAAKKKYCTPTILKQHDASPTSTTSPKQQQQQWQNASNSGGAVPGPHTNESEGGGGSMLNPMNWGITKAVLGSGNNKKLKQKKIRTWDQKAISNWTNKDVKLWINSLPKAAKYCPDKFPKDVNGKELLKTTENDLKLIIVKDMWRERFMSHLELAKNKYATAPELDGDEYEDVEMNDIDDDDDEKSKGEVNGIIGLYNQGNTCYMNTCIQIFSQTPYITRYLSNRARLNLGNNRNYPMLTALTSLCHIIYNERKSYRNQYKKITPSAIRATLSNIDAGFGSGSQDDSSRALDYMLSALDNDIEAEIKDQKQQKRAIKIKDKISIQPRDALSGTEISKYVNKLLAEHNPSDSVFKNTFDGIEHISCQCLECNKIWHQFTTFRILDLQVISHEITIRNINIVCNNNYYQIEVTALNYCPVDILKYHAIKYLLQQNEQIVYYDVELLLISQNGKIKPLNNCKLTDLQNTSASIFVLVNSYKNRKSSNKKKSTLLQLNIFMDKGGKQKRRKQQFKPAICTKYNPNTVHDFATNKIETLERLNHDNDDDDDEKHDYYVIYNGNVFSTKELEKDNFTQKMHNYGSINLLVLLCVNQQNEDYCYNINNVDECLLFESTERHSGLSKLAALKKEKSFWETRKEKVSRNANAENIENYIDNKLIKIMETMSVYQAKNRIANGVKNFIFNRYQYISPERASPRKLGTLTECIEGYEKAQILDSVSYAHPCPCKLGRGNSEWVKVQKKIVHSPPVFLFHLDRYGDNYTTKRSNSRSRYNNNNYNYNNYYSSNKFDHDIVYSVRLGYDEKYNLYGVSNHSGSTPKGGHYTASVKCLSNGNWYSISDSTIHSEWKPESHTRDATILAYSRVQN